MSNTLPIVVPDCDPRASRDLDARPPSLPQEAPDRSPARRVGGAGATKERGRHREDHDKT